MDENDFVKATAQPLWVNFYAKGNGSVHFTRESADAMAIELTGNPRIACKKVFADIGEGLSKSPAQN